MLGTIFNALHYSIGLLLGIILLPIAYIQVFFPLGIALAVTIWPTAFIAFCFLSLTFVFWFPALILGLIVFGILSFILEVASSIIGTFRDAFRQPPQHPQPYSDVPALPSGIPASRSDSVVTGYGLPSTPGTPGIDGATDMSSWLEKRFAGLTQREADDDDEIGLIMPGGRPPRNYPPRRPSFTVAGSLSSVNTTSTLGYSTSSLNSNITTTTANPSITSFPSPTSPRTPTRRRSRTKSMSFEDGSRPNVPGSHSTTSMVTASRRVSSQQEGNSSTTSLVSNAGSVEDATAPLRVGQLMAEASEDELMRN